MGSSDYQGETEMGPRSKSEPADTKRTRGLGRALFRRLDSWCRERDVKLAVTTTGWHRPPYVSDREPTEAFMSGARAFFEELDVPFFDPSAQMREIIQEHPEYIIEGDGHPNEKGAAITAEKITPFVMEQVDEMLRIK